MNTKTTITLICRMLICCTAFNISAYSQPNHATAHQNNPTSTYYYQQNSTKSTQPNTSLQMSAINNQQSDISFLQITSNRIMAIHTNKQVSHQMTMMNNLYYLDDGKSTAMFLSPETITQPQKTPALTTDYQAYGTSSQTRPMTSDTNFSYNNEYQDPSTGLTYLRARNYQPDNQRFISMDSYLVWNKYNFADANPISNLDPTGHHSKTIKFLEKYWPDLVMSVLGLAMIWAGARETRYIDYRTIDTGKIDVISNLRNHLQDPKTSGFGYLKLFTGASLIGTTTINTYENTKYTDCDNPDTSDASIAGFVQTGLLLITTLIQQARITYVEKFEMPKFKEYTARRNP